MHAAGRIAHQEAMSQGAWALAGLFFTYLQNSNQSGTTVPLVENKQAQKQPSHHQHLSATPADKTRPAKEVKEL